MPVRTRTTGIRNAPAGYLAIAYGTYSLWTDAALAAVGVEVLVQQNAISPPPPHRSVVVGTARPIGGLTSVRKLPTQ